MASQVWASKTRPTLRLLAVRVQGSTAYARHVRYVLSGLYVVFLVLMFAGAVTGRVRARCCCAVPIEKDPRMRAALEDPSRG